MEQEKQQCAGLSALGEIGMKIAPNAATDQVEWLERLFTADGRPREGLEREKSLSCAEVAILFQMTERSIRKLASEGALPDTRTLGGGRICIRRGRSARCMSMFRRFLGQNRTQGQHRRQVGWKTRDEVARSTTNLLGPSFDYASRPSSGGRRDGGHDLRVWERQQR